MNRGCTGRYRIQTTLGESVRAFIPAPLPPEPPVVLDGMLQSRLESALLALGRLDSITTLLPDTALFLYTYVRKEAVLSSQIEGTQSSLSDLLLFEVEAAPGIPLDDVTEVSNYVAAMEHGLLRLREGFPLCNRLIREIHTKLLSTGRGSDQERGRFRRSQNWIGGTRPGNAHFVPPPPEDIEPCMSDLEKFLHAEEPFMPQLIRAGLAHVQFETIHPFLDGNGRLGRLLITFILCHRGMLREPLLYLSLFFKQHRDEYYRLLDQVRTEGEWEAWICFFLEGVAVTAEGALETARRLVELFARDRQRIQRQGREAGSMLRAFEALKRRPVLTLPGMCRLSGLTHPTVSAAMQRMERLGIVRELTGHARNRVFGYLDYLAILNEGTESP